MKRPVLIKSLLLLSVISGFFIFYTSKIPQASFEFDEHTWIVRGAIFFDLAFLKRDFSRPEWRDWTSYDQAKLPEFFYGALLYAAYRQSPVKTLTETDFGVTLLKPKNEWAGQIRVPLSQIPQRFRRNIDILVLARTAVVFIAMICLLFTFLIGLQLRSDALGFTALLILAINPLFRSQAVTAKSDILFLCTLLITFYLSLKYLEKAAWKTLVLLGIFSGLNAAAKLHGLLIIVVVTVGLAGTAVVNRRFGKSILRIVVFPVIAFTVFIILNPFTWTDPVANTIYMIRSRYESNAEFCASYPGHCAPTLRQRFQALTRDLIGPVNDYNSFHRIRWLDTTLLIIGVTVLLHARERERLKYCWFIFWSMTIIPIITTLMVFLVPRYDMVFLPWIGITESLGITGIMETVCGILKKRYGGNGVLG